MVACGAVEALAFKRAVFAIEAGIAVLLASPPLVTIGADAGSCYRVTFGSVLALTAITAVRTPEITLTTCTERVCTVNI